MDMSKKQGKKDIVKRKNRCPTSRCTGIPIYHLRSCVLADEGKLHTEQFSTLFPPAMMNIRPPICIFYMELCAWERGNEEMI